VLVHPDGQEQDFLGSKESTTNNEMGLLAAIHGLRQTPEGERVTICSDSSWLINCGTGYWRRHVYPELWAELDALRRARTVSWRKVKAHTGDPYNEKADELANLARRLITDRGVSGTA
jgi:ribonuclease HI